MRWAPLAIVFVVCGPHVPMLPPPHEVNPIVIDDDPQSQRPDDDDEWTRPQDDDAVDGGEGEPEPPRACAGPACDDDLNHLERGRSNPYLDWMRHR